MSKIKTWEERLRDVNSIIRKASPLPATITCMAEEIKELRAALSKCNAQLQIGAARMVIGETMDSGGAGDA